MAAQHKLGENGARPADASRAPPSQDAPDTDRQLSRFGEVDEPPSVEDEPEEDCTRLDPQAQAIALQTLRELNGATEKMPPMSIEEAAAHVARTERPPPIVLTEPEPESQEKLDGADLFAGIAGPRNVGGTAIFNISDPQSPYYTALPRDVTPYIHHEEEPLAAAPPKKRSRPLLVVGLLLVLFSLAAVCVWLYVPQARQLVRLP